ncbi:kinase-like domain-containing protein [Mycena galericulata]|nr:kinase-like domain-containing protein [Mycena galericulata]
MDSPVSPKNASFRAQIETTLGIYRSYPEKYRLWSEYKGEHVYPENRSNVVFWYGRNQQPGELQAPPRFCVRLLRVDEPDTLAWKIVHYEADLPYYDENLEITGDDIIRQIPFIEQPNDDDDDEEDTDEDCTAQLALLPLVDYEPSIHFVKKARFKAEILNLLRCKGSPHIVQLLGRSADNHLVFPRYKLDVYTFAIHYSLSRFLTIGFVKRLLLSMIDGVAYLHSLGIIHGDLTARNLLMSGDLSSSDPEPAVVIADLQCFAASYSAAPELRVRSGWWDMSTFSPASDIYALGVCLREFMLPVHHRSSMMGFDVPVPFKDIYEACTQELPQNRPSPPVLRQMALDIEE